MSEETKEIKKRRQTVNLPTSILHPHPKNPRKDLGDLTELTESIKKNGIMQNLTVIPGYYDEDAFINDEEEYTVIIGHRRLEAAKAAGLAEVPCRIYENLPENDQIATMLEENMQRNDLTVYEQAQSFQLMLDLGETVDTLSEKTGFAKSTIYHRLNIAKLDQDTLKEKEEDEGFQLHLNDLIELEQIKDIKTRDEILKEARNSNDLRFRAEQAAKLEKINDREQRAREILENTDMQEGDISDSWSSKWETIYRQDFREDHEFSLDDIDAEITDELKYAFSNYHELKILKPDTEKEPCEANEEESEPSWRKAVREREEREAIYKPIRKLLDVKTHDFIEDILSGKLDDIEEVEKYSCSDALFNACMGYDYDTTFMTLEEIIEFRTGTDRWDFEKEDDFKDEIKKAEKLPLHHKLLVSLGITLSRLDPVNYKGAYNMDEGRQLMVGYDILERWGWSFTDEELALMNGTHDVYVEEDE